MDVSSKRRRCVESSALQRQAMWGDDEGDAGRPLGVVKTVGVNQVRNLACIAHAHVILQACMGYYAFPHWNQLRIQVGVNVTTKWHGKELGSQESCFAVKCSISFISSLLSNLSRCSFCLGLTAPLFCIFFFSC